MTLPAHAFKDPALIVEQNDLRDKGCRVCDHVIPSLGRYFCSHPSHKINHARVPNIGTKCKFFKLEVK
jgi:hypothetical protein